jgi:hypothetical protein
VTIGNMKRHLNILKGKKRSQKGQLKNKKGKEEGALSQS